MKRFIFYFSFLAILLVLSSKVKAQDASATVNASAVVVGDLTATVEDAVAFGTIAADLSPTPTLDLSDGSESGTSGDGVFGLVHLSGEENQDVAIAWNSQSNSLTLDDGGGNTVNWTITGGVVDGNIAQGAFTGTTTINNDGNQNATLDGGGLKTVVFGGTLNNASPATLPAGTYSGSMTVNVDYTFGS